MAGWPSVRPSGGHYGFLDVQVPAPGEEQCLNQIPDMERLKLIKVNAAGFSCWPYIELPHVRELIQGIIDGPLVVVISHNNEWVLVLALEVSHDIFNIVKGFLAPGSHIVGWEIAGNGEQFSGEP